MICEKPSLFASRREFLSVMALLLGIFLSRSILLYYEYTDFIVKPFYFTNAKVLDQHTNSSNGRSYEVLKLQGSDGKSFYTTSYRKQDLSGKILRVKMFPNSKITFFDYLGDFYVKTTLRVIGESPERGKKWVLDAIAAQHQHPDMGAFYQAVFFAAPVSKSLRDTFSKLGASHIVALSGFHLTLLWGLIYGGLGLLYRWAQQRWFPYRLMLFDLGILTLILLGWFLWFVDFPPSLVRSYAMLLIAWVLLLMGVELLSFEFLGSIVMLLLALLPSLSISLGFWLSVFGVYYIYLVLYWSRQSGGWLNNTWVILLLSIPIGIYILMHPVIHGIFGVISQWQLLSPVLALLFTPFYPIVIGLHLVGYGGVFDDALLGLFALPSETREHILPLWAVAAYGILSFWSIWSRGIFLMTLGSAALYMLYTFFFV